MTNMIRIRIVFFFGILVVTIFIILSYSIIIPNVAQNEVIVRLNIEEKILLRVSSLPDIYHRYNEIDNATKLFFSYLKNEQHRRTFTNLWREANADVFVKLYDTQNPNLGNYLHAMKTAKVTKVDLDTRGTQLKFLLTLEGDQQVVFKPKWYNKDKVITGPVYAGKDRYNSEILAFYLTAILHKPFAPLAAQRALHFRNEILPNATPRLLNTYLKIENISCVHGECLYCRKSDPICEDSLGNIDGVVIFNIDKSLVTHRNPWQRTYKNNVPAPWQSDLHFCKSLTNKISKTRLYDLIDTAIFDFLIQNGDRHHYETLNERVVFIDNGKGLGNPYIHHIDILAPLYQCCMLREIMWDRLKTLSGGLLRELLKSVSNVTDVVSDLHLNAIDKRLLIVFATIEYCKFK